MAIRRSKEFDAEALKSLQGILQAAQELQMPTNIEHPPRKDHVNDWTEGIQGYIDMIASDLGDSGVDPAYIGELLHPLTEFSLSEEFTHTAERASQIMQRELYENTAITPQQIWEQAVRSAKEYQKGEKFAELLPRINATISIILFLIAISFPVRTPIDNLSSVIDLGTVTIGVLAAIFFLEKFLISIDNYKKVVRGTLEYGEVRKVASDLRRSVLNFRDLTDAELYPFSTPVGVLATTILAVDALLKEKTQQ